jgi:DNA-binding response OmpR family regulator
MTTEAAQRHILVINDSPALLDLYRGLLVGEGYRVSLAAITIVDPTEISRIAPDLIVLDFMFGEEHHGLELLQKLRMDRTTAPIPVVVCAAAIEPIRQMESHLLDKGTGLVLKPFDADELFAEIDHAWSMLAEQQDIASTNRVITFPGRLQRPPPPVRPHRDSDGD